MAKGNDKRYNKKSRTQNVKTVVVADKKVVDATELATNDRENEYGNEGEANALGSVSKFLSVQFPGPQNSGLPAEQKCLNSTELYPRKI